MALLVVPLDSSEASLLTLGELERIEAASEVVFEDRDHSLIERLPAEKVKAGAIAGDVDVGAHDTVLVTRSDSPRLVELARAGAEISSGASVAPDALTGAHGASVLRRASARLGDLALVMARLRSPDGCPWDLEQDHRTLVVHLLEEANEVAEAIENEVAPDELAGELGDVLLQVFFHAQMAADAGNFDVADVAAAIVAKLVRRHPHVFGDVKVGSAAEVVANWHKIKEAEKSGIDPHGLLS